MREGRDRTSHVHTHFNVHIRQMRISLNGLNVRFGGGCLKVLSVLLSGADVCSGTRQFLFTAPRLLVLGGGNHFTIFGLERIEWAVSVLLGKD